jgi:hypothetical protein
LFVCLLLALRVIDVGGAFTTTRQQEKQQREKQMTLMGNVERCGLHTQSKVAKNKKTTNGGIQGPAPS